MHDTVLTGMSLKLATGREERYELIGNLTTSTTPPSTSHATDSSVYSRESRSVVPSVRQRYISAALPFLDSAEKSIFDWKLRVIN